MKNAASLLGLCFLTLLTFSACEKDLPRYFEFDGYEFASLDENGGSWTPILIDSPEDIVIPAPADRTSALYLGEIETAKAQIARMSSADAKAVTYWTQNPIIRWNEIALELSAKYNLIPGPNADGTYTLPSKANPEGPPVFPFAHPPYTVRALAYLSVAQYDGLITAWHYKFEYNRPAPFVVDNSIEPAYFENLIPAYPSDGAVIAAASRKVLTEMFPLEAEYLAAQEAEHFRCLLLSGVNVQSDIDEGKQIGDAVADIALARAATDGMSKAQTSKAVSDSIAQAAYDRFGWKWVNQELPQRPVGLTPLYGKVRMWSVENVEETRVPPPPAIGSPEFEADIAILKDYAANVTLERRHIANFWQDGIGTYTPPSHWNHLAKSFIVKNRLSPIRTARTYAYLNMAMMDAGISCWDSKYYYHYPRPIELIPEFKTILGTPNFPAYTSGHSVFSAAGAEVLAYIFPEETDRVREWAEEAALSRLYGGIHWTFDATVGTDQGRNVAGYTIRRARLDGAD